VFGLMLALCGSGAARADGTAHTGTAVDTADSGDSGGSGDTGQVFHSGQLGDTSADTGSPPVKEPDPIPLDTAIATRDTGRSSSPAGTTASDLAEEEGGSPWSDGECGCSAGGSAPLGIWMAAGLLAVRRRREKDSQFG